MTKIQIDKAKLEKLEALAPLLKKAKLHIEGLNAKLHRRSKFAGIKLSSAKFAAAVAEEVQAVLEEQGIPEPVAATAAEAAAGVVAEAESSAEGQSEEMGQAAPANEAMAAISPEVEEQLAEVMEELPPDVKAQVAEMSVNPSVDKMARLMIPILKKVAKKSAFSSMGSVTDSGMEATRSVEKTAALNKIHQLCK